MRAQLGGPGMAMRSSSASQNKQRVMEGPLSKWTNVVHGWQYRWFVLDQASGLLSYYTVRDVLYSVVRT